MKVIWTPEAQKDRFDIWNHIATDNSIAAARIDNIFSEAVANLSQHPELGQSGSIPGTRELIPHESYRLVYEINHNVVWILVLIHTSRQWPPVSKQI